jgi:hypothetical protein
MDVQFASEGPELVQTFNLEGHPITANCDVDHDTEGTSVGRLAFCRPIDRGRGHGSWPRQAREGASAAARRRAETRMPMPTRFIAPMRRTIFNAKVDTLSTLMIGNTDSTM